jgi:hypothetical protein
MANYDYSPQTIVGFLQKGGGNRTRRINADIGGGLLNLLIDFHHLGLAQDAISPGVPSAAIAAVPQGFQFLPHLVKGAKIHPDDSVSPTDWGGVRPNTFDDDKFESVEIEDPSFTTTEPSPVLADWATKLGGTVG